MPYFGFNRPFAFRNWAGSNWAHRFGARRPGYGFRRGIGFRPGLFGWHGGYRGGYGYHYPHQHQWQLHRHWPHIGRRGYAPPTYGYAAPSVSAPQPVGPNWIQWAQASLAQAVGSWVLQDGVMGPNTRKAILIFQAKQGLPGTGMLDSATVQALQAATAPQAAPPMAVAPPPSDDAAAAAAAAQSAPDAGAPDAAAPPDANAQPDDAGGAPPDGASGELFWSPWRHRRGRGRRHGRRGGWGGWGGPGGGFGFQPGGDDDDNDSEA